MNRPFLRWGRLLLAALALASAAVDAARATEAADARPPQAQAIERALASVVGLRAQALDDARSAATLGQRRQGSGVVIGADGLVLTIGYLILEADRVDLDLDDGRSLPARVVAYDVATGFALVQALAPLAIVPAPLGRSSGLADGETLIVVSGGNAGAASMVRVAAQHAFSGYWEYHIDNALFTAPARGDHSGAGLFDTTGRLIGIGSLVLRDLSPYLAAGESGRPGNMFVPIDLLPPIIDELRATGRSRASMRAWLGINCVEEEGRVRIARITDDSPADVAGLLAGDKILRLDGRPIANLEQLWQALWSGGAQREITLDIERGEQARTVKAHTVDRATALRRPEGI